MTTSLEALIHNNNYTWLYTWNDLEEKNKIYSLDRQLFPLTKFKQSREMILFMELAVGTTRCRVHFEKA